MSMTPAWRTRLFTIAAGLVAVCSSIGIASGEFVWPAAISALLGLFLLARYLPMPLGTALLGAVFVGYILGNRGFAQITLIPGFPLLPAEAVLLIAGGQLLVQSAWRHQYPFRRDPLNAAILAWIIVGAGRIVFDVRTFGFLALRDFALVYYAAFFFLGQEIGQAARGRRFLANVLAMSCAGLVPLVFIYDRFPSFFFETLVWRGNPVIYFKGDLTATFMAAGAVMLFLRFENQKRWWQVVGSVVLAASVVASDSRAALLGLFVAALWLALRGRWRFAAIQGVGAVLAAITISGAALLFNTPWEKTPVFGLYERIVSLADPAGERVYRGAQTFNKGGNNLFRTVWWRIAIDETIESNPYVGLGFGHDLAARFVREYYPENTEDFSVRSPHNVLITIFARMGALGLVLFLTVIAVLAVRTWRTLPGDASGLWGTVWVILTSACFGVVLEGPMGAVVFWTTLGVANASLPPAKEGTEPVSPKSALLATAFAENTAPALPTPTPSVSRERAAP